MVKEDVEATAEKLPVTALYTPPARNQPVTLGGKGVWEIQSLAERSCDQLKLRGFSFWKKDREMDC